MVEVVLVTQDNGFVTAVTMPEFHQFPDVIIWGERVFVYDRRLHEREKPRYTEAFTWWAPPSQAGVSA